MGFGTVFSVFWFTGFVLAAIGAGSALRRVLWLWQGWQNRAWPSVEGVVLHASVRHKYEPRGGATGSRSVYVPEIAYAYEVDGRSFEGEAIAVGPIASGFAGVVGRLVDEFQVGSSVPVHHHPRHPERAVLRTGPIRSDLWALPFEVAVVAAGAYVLAWGASLGGGPSETLALLRGLLLDGR